MPIAPKQIDHTAFIELLTEHLPEVAAQIDEYERGLLHLEMGSFARATQEAIEHGEMEEVRRHFLFADELLQQADREVENAIYVSYLENLYFEGRNSDRRKAKELLTPRLKQALQELEEYLDQLHRKSKDA